MTEDLSHLGASLRALGGDTARVEVKSAAGGLPASLTPTLSALANLPGGGLVVLGLDERTGFSPVPIPDPQSLKQGLAAKARAYRPPVRLHVADATVDGHPVVCATVHECDPSAKPCEVASTGTAYLRGHDGDFMVSDLERQAFLAARRPPHVDREPVAGATIDDLDPELVGPFVESVHERDPQGLGRFTDEAELLLRAGVMTVQGAPSVAGILALGVHPQQFFPRFVVQAAADPLPGDDAATRARNQTTITGAIPRMLDQALAWARRTMGTAIVTAPDGSVRDRFDYPVVAVRELVANALVHRDLDHWSAGLAIELRLRRDRCVVSNPGGLYGISTDRLGVEGVTSARNARLVSICQHVRSPESGNRVIEALASGMPLIARELSRAGSPPARFTDAGIRFTAVLCARASARSATPALTPTQRRVYDALAAGPLTADQLARTIGLSAPTIRKALRTLQGLGLTASRGGRGRRTDYLRTDDETAGRARA